jgi:wobble nucleotide-excising tRNase
VLQNLQLLRQVGQFDAVDSGRHLPLAKITLIYAENARGKTTLAAILRSLKTGDSALIAERHRLAAANPPHVVLSVDRAPPHVF